MSPDLKRFAEINGAYGWMKHEKVHPDVLRDAIQDGLRVETSHKGGQYNYFARSGNCAKDRRFKRLQMRPAKKSRYKYKNGRRCTSN